MNPDTNGSSPMTSLAKIDKTLLRIGRQWRHEGFPVPLAMRIKFKFGFVAFEFTILAGYNQQSASGEVIDVPQLFYEDASVLQVARGPSKGYKEREQLREALTNLEAGKIIRLTPDDGESMRKLKRMVTEAGKDIDRPVRHMEDGTDLLVFFPVPKAEGAPQRGRPKKQQTEE